MTIESAGGDVITLEATLTVDTSAYATGELIGKAAAGNGVASNPIVFALPEQANWKKGAGFLIQDVILVDEAKQNVAIDVIFFNASPSGTTFTDQAALDIADADMNKIIGGVSITTYFSYSDNSHGQAVNQGILGSVAGGSLYACLVSRGAPTYAAADDLRLRVKLAKISD